MNNQNNQINPVVNAIGLIKNLSKQSITELANDIIDNVNNGDVDALVLRIKFKAIKEIIEKVEGRIQDQCIQEALKFKGQDVDNCKIEVRNSGDRLQYDEDPIYQELKTKLKNREELLKLAYKQRGTMIFDENGIEVPVVSILAGKESLYLTIK